jgi:toxin FitB
MIICDTNVISEIIKDDCAPNVRRWLVGIAAEDMATTSINAVELLGGVAIMPEGKRKAELQRSIETCLDVIFETRVLHYDIESAKHHAELVSSMRRNGHGIGFADCQIAAIARQHGCTVVTRDVGPFQNAGLKVINPWTDE